MANYPRDARREMTNVGEVVNPVQGLQQGFNSAADLLNSFYDRQDKEKQRQEEQARWDKSFALKQEEATRQADQWDKDYTLKQALNARQQQEFQNKQDEIVRAKQQRELLTGASPIVEQRLREQKASLYQTAGKGLEGTKMGSAAKEYSNWLSSNGVNLDTAEGKAQAQAKYNELLNEYGLTPEQGVQMSASLGQQFADLGVKASSKSDATKAFKDYLMNTGKFTPAEANAQANELSSGYFDAAAMQKMDEERVKNVNEANQKRLDSFIKADKAWRQGIKGSSPSTKGITNYSQSPSQLALNMFKDTNFMSQDAAGEASEWAKEEKDNLNHTDPLFARLNEAQKNQVINAAMMEGASQKWSTDEGTFGFDSESADKAISNAIKSGNYLQYANSKLSGLSTGVKSPYSDKIRELLTAPIATAGNVKTGISTGLLRDVLASGGGGIDKAVTPAVSSREAAPPSTDSSNASLPKEVPNKSVNPTTQETENTQIDLTRLLEGSISPQTLDEVTAYNNAGPAEKNRLMRIMSPEAQREISKQESEKWANMLQEFNKAIAAPGRTLFSSPYNTSK